MKYTFDVGAELKIPPSARSETLIGATAVKLGLYEFPECCGLAVDSDTGKLQRALFIES